MPDQSQSPFSGIVLTDEPTLSLKQLCQDCNLPTQRVTAYIREGIISVDGKTPEEWRFSRLTVIRIRKASRLENDLRLNPAGVALALQLMEQVDSLQQRLKRYEG